MAAIGAALYFPWLSRLSLVERITACLVLAYVLWMLGLLVRRGKSFMADRLGLRPLDYELPLFDLAAVVGLVAVLLKFDGGLEHGRQWTAHAWVPLVLSPLALGMIRAYPRREFLHVSLVFLIWGVISVIAPSLSDPHFLVLSLVVCSLGLQVTDLAIRPGEQVLGDRLGIQDASLGAILRAWWCGLGVSGIILGSAVVMAGMDGALAHSPEVGLTISTIDWWTITGAIVLVGTQIVLAGLDSDLLDVLRPEGLIVGVELTGVALLWWLGVASSPLGMWDIAARPLLSSRHGVGRASHRRVATRGWASVRTWPRQQGKAAHSRPVCLCCRRRSSFFRCWPRSSPSTGRVRPPWPHSYSWRWPLDSGPCGGSKFGPRTWRGWPGRRRAWRVAWWSAATATGSRPSRA